VILGLVYLGERSKVGYIYYEAEKNQRVEICFLL